MPELAVIAAAIATVAAAGVVAVDRRTWISRRRHREVVVHMKDERSIRGVLTYTARDGLVLQAARYLEGAGTDLAGEVYLPREDVSFVQITERSSRT